MTKANSYTRCILMLLYSIMLLYSRNIVLFNQVIKTKTRNATEMYRKKSKKQSPILSDKYSIDNGYWYLSFPFTVMC